MIRWVASRLTFSSSVESSCFADSLVHDQLSDQIVSVSDCAAFAALAACAKHVVPVLNAVGNDHDDDLLE